MYIVDGYNPCEFLLQLESSGMESYRDPVNLGQSRVSVPYFSFNATLLVQYCQRLTKAVSGPWFCSLQHP